MSHVLQIVPKLPPLFDGVGDYALNLAQQLRKDCGLETEFIVGDDGWDGPEQIEGFKVSKVSARTWESLVKLLSKVSDAAPPVLLHYVGYGYQKRGCPRWLVEGLCRWNEQESDRVLLTMFHEIYASGPVWTSSFWLSHVQQRLSACLARISRASITSRFAYAEIINRMSRKYDSVSVLPVFSNVGEPHELPVALAGRDRKLVVFGSKGQRELVFKKSLRTLGQVCNALEITEVLDIGIEIHHGASHIGEARVIPTGRLAAEDVSRLLLGSVAGFLHYPADYLSKSTIFAAYCAHRIIPIVASSTEGQAEELEDGTHFWSAKQGRAALSFEKGQEMADRAHLWYQSHSLPVQAKIFAAYLSPTTILK